MDEKYKKIKKIIEEEKLLYFTPGAGLGEALRILGTMNLQCKYIPEAECAATLGEQKQCPGTLDGRCPDLHLANEV